MDCFPCEEGNLEKLAKDLRRRVNFPARLLVEVSPKY